MKTRFLIIIVIVIASSGLSALAYVLSLESNEFGIPGELRRYVMMKASCNNSTDHLDGECFVNAFENCESARIKQMSSTVEGDPVFYYATIMPEDSCNIHFEKDFRLDKWKGIAVEGIIQRTCTDVKLSERHLDFQCGDESEKIQLR